MALTSPGVQVNVIDESFYTPAEPGTVPLIVVATAQNKINGAGNGLASATTKANAGKAFKLTSQRDLTELFGVPFFEKTASSTPVHGSERNEYGLLAAYSLLGVSNAAFIVRADVDLNQLAPETTEPGANPNNGAWWIDTRGTAWGIQEWNGATLATVGGQKFTTKFPIILTDNDTTKIDSGAPKESVGAIGDYAVVFETTDGTGSGLAKEQITIWYKTAGNGTTVTAGTWVEVGSNDWAAGHATIEGAARPGPIGDTILTEGDSGDFLVNGSYINVVDGDTVTDIVGRINSASITGVTANAIANKIYLFADNTADSTGGGADGKISIQAVTPGSAVTAGSFVVGRSYTVTSLGSTTNTQWNTIGGTSSVTYTVGTEFVAANTGTGLGNGTATADPAVLSAIGLTAGTFACPALQQTPHTQVPSWKLGNATPRPTGSVWIKTTEPNQGARWRAKRWSSATASWVSYEAPIYATTHAAINGLDRSGGGAGISIDSLFVQSNANEYNTAADPATTRFRVWRRAIAATTQTSIVSKTITTGTVGSAGSKAFTIYESVKGSDSLAAGIEVDFTAANNATDAETIAAAINAAGFTNIVASLIEVTAGNNPTSQLQISHKLGGDFRITDTDGVINSIFSGVYNLNTGTGTANLHAAPDGAVGVDYVVSGWTPLAASEYAASPDAPLNEPADGQLWYNPNFAEVDIMIHNGNTWVGYRALGSPFRTSHTETSETGYLPIVSASNPYNDEVVTGDLWISTADLENYPTIYRYNASLTGIPNEAKWELVDKTDQTTEEGILFADARYNVSGSISNEAGAIADLITSNYLDTDAPDPALYPRGMLLWNLRRSGGNVKRYVNNYIDTAENNARFDANNSPNGNTFAAGESQSAYKTDRWVTASGNNEDGSGSFGRKAQRKVVVAAMKSAVDTSSEIRDEERRNFNLIACPGYPELMSNLVNLNIDRGITAFVVGDTPLRLPADATSLVNYGTNANLVTDNGDDGIISYDEYLATYYPNGITTDLSGSPAVVPSSHMMLRTIALSDNVSFPWFAPAGTRRGGITNATSVGYIDAATGEFQTVALNEGQRDTLYDLKINPIPFFNGVGLVAYGQKTRARNASALDRINVARLVVYLRSQLNRLARPYIFEPNDKITRDEIKQAVESLLLELVGLRALYDFAVVCDETNNTPARIDRNELYVDIAIEPVKAVEFIYIPLRVRNTGEI